MEDYSRLSNLFEVKVGTLSKDINNVLTNFGFNEEEIKIILDTNDNIEEVLLVDLFHNTHVKLMNDDSEIAKELKNKILMILKYYLQTRQNNSNFSKVMEKAIEEFNDVIVTKNRLGK